MCQTFTSFVNLKFLLEQFVRRLAYLYKTLNLSNELRYRLHFHKSNHNDAS
jgi:hypothetical protein